MGRTNVTIRQKIRDRIMCPSCQAMKFREDKCTACGCPGETIRIGELATPKGSLRVWWVPQVPMKAFYVSVPDLRTARLMLDTLARYDLFQFENNIKPDYCNIGGLMVWDGTAWIDWHDIDGTDFDDVPDEHLTQAVWEWLEDTEVDGEGK